MKTTWMSIMWPMRRRLDWKHDQCCELSSAAAAALSVSKTHCVTDLGVCSGLQHELVLLFAAAPGGLLRPQLQTEYSQGQFSLHSWWVSVELSSTGLNPRSTLEWKSSSFCLILEWGQTIFFSVHLTWQKSNQMSLNFHFHFISNSKMRKLVEPALRNAIHRATSNENSNVTIFITVLMFSLFFFPPKLYGTRSGNIFDLKTQTETNKQKHVKRYTCEKVGLEFRYLKKC